MPPRRSTRSKPDTDTQAEASTSTKDGRESKGDKMAATAPKVFILPDSQATAAVNGSVEHTILNFSHPCTGASIRFLLHHPREQIPSSSTPFLYEILKIANPISTPRSWLVTPMELADANSQAKDSLVIKDAHLYLTTPYDPIYLLLNHLSTSKISRNYLSLDDILEQHPQSSSWNQVTKLHKKSQDLLAARLALVCDTVEAGDEVMYRLSQKKMLDTLVARVEKAAKKLPPSILKHINRKLSKPIGLQATTLVRRQPAGDTSGGIVNDAELEEEVLQETGEASDALKDSVDADSQLRREASRLTLNKEDSSISQADTETPAEESGGGDEIVTKTDLLVEDLLPPPEIQFISHLAHAIQFMQNYLSEADYSSLREEIEKRYPTKPLDDYMEELKNLRAAATAAMDMSMMHTKRTLDDMEGGMTREEAEREKKRKKKEEDAKKSTAVKKLEKVNTKGMMKMTAFFKKKE